MERFERIGVGWFATCIVGGVAVVAAGLIALPDYPLIGVVLVTFGSLAILIGIAGIVAEIVIQRRTPRHARDGDTTGIQLLPRKEGASKMRQAHASLDVTLAGGSLADAGRG